MTVEIILVKVNLFFNITSKVIYQHGKPKKQKKEGKVIQKAHNNISMIAQRVRAVNMALKEKNKKVLRTREREISRI